MNNTNHKNTKFLLIHGFGGGVHEVKPLAEHLISNGFEAVCPLLKGHSAARKDMQKVTYEDWIDSAEKELLTLKKTGGDIILIGFSMGGLIAFNFAYKYDVKTIITINTPIEIKV
jgi:Esterase/lipase